MSVAFEEVLRLIDSHAESAALLTLDAGALPQLRQIVTEGEVYLATRAASLVCSIEAREAVSVLAVAAASPHEEVRVAAAAGAWQLAAVGVDEVPTHQLGDADAGVQRFALRSVARRAAMSRTAHPADKLMQQVSTLAARGEPLTREFALSVAKRLRGEPPSREEVAAALSSRWFVADAADMLGPGALEHLAGLAEDPDPDVAARATRLAAVLPGVPGAARLAVVAVAARHRQPGVRTAAADSVRQVLEPGSEQIIVQLLRDDLPEVRRSALAAAAKYPQLPGVRESVEKQALDDPDLQLRELARTTLRRNQDPRTRE